jgi:hypothetical protein
MTNHNQGRWVKIPTTQTYEGATLMIEFRFFIGLNFLSIAS